MHAFDAIGGVARELWYDNLATVVAEHEGNLVCFNPRFLSFAREYDFIPRACHVAAAWEKGKIERAIGYIRQNFWPLRHFTDLPDANSPAHHWLETVANRRRHRETGEIPNERFRPECLKLLPSIAPDYRDSVEALVHKDLRLSFDGNRYCVPPRYVGRRLTVKADSSSVIIYDQHQEIVRYLRCWWRGQTFGAERFQKELFAQMVAAERQASQHRVVALLGPASEEYLRQLANTDRSLTRQVRELLTLIRDYGPSAVADRHRARPRRPRIRLRLHRQHSSSAANSPGCSAASGTQRPGPESTGHRSIVAGRIRRFHSAFSKGVL